MKPRGIVLHTVGVKGDSSVAVIRKYHRSLGWKDIGYHFLVRKSGLVEPGRPLTQTGAHAQGANDTIGICVAGDGDTEAWTLAQTEAVLKLIVAHCRANGWGADKVAGHREAQAVFGGAPTGKTCPGKLVDMVSVRAAVARELARPTGAKAGLV